MNALREEIRKETLDVFNRLHSIHEDAAFVADIHYGYPDLPLISNLRCGAWYVNPTHATSFAYFKSTDGHYNNWSFNLRRSNLHLLPIALQHHGVIIVDSTRSGKRFPDALSKTVPIWCAVVNHAIQLRHGVEITSKDESRLYTIASSVSAQEHHQMELRIDAWARELATSTFQLPALPCPLRPLWISPSTTVLPNIDTCSFIPVICVCASRQVAAGLDRRSAGFAYVQGSADDHELWGKGLTADLFWRYNEELLRSPRHALSGLISSLVASGSCCTPIPSYSGSTAFVPSAITRVGGRIQICMLSEVTDPPPTRYIGTDGATNTSYILGRPEASETEFHHGSGISPPILVVQVIEGKKGQDHFLRSVLPRATRFARTQLEAGRIVVIACVDGKDTSVGIALSIIQTCFNVDGHYTNSGADTATKESIRTRLQWIIASRPEANPSRTTLKRVNEFLLSPVGFRSWQATS